MKTLSTRLIACEDHEVKNDVIIFTRGVPPNEAFPVDQLLSCFDAAIHNDPNITLQYGQRAGYTPLRKLLASEYCVTEEDVFISNGSLQLLDILTTLVVTPGATILTEQPSYDRSISIFRQHNAQVLGIPLEPDGISIEKLETEVKRHIPVLLYLVPDFQNPSGVLTSLEKRRAIIDLANRYNFLVVEDIPYRKLRYRGADLPMMRSIDSRRVITMSSFSKLLSPGLRVGYMIASKQLVTKMAEYAENTYLSPVLPTQAMVAEYMQRNWLPSNIEKLKRLYHPRWEAMIQAVKTYLSDSEMIEPDGGFFVGVNLPKDANTTNLIARARSIDLVLTHGVPFFANSDPKAISSGERFIRLPFCAVTPSQINEGVRRLASLL